MKTILMVASSAAALGLAACGQGAYEEAGERADTAYEQATTGTTDLGQGKLEEQGEQLDELHDETGATPPPPTTP